MDTQRLLDRIHALFPDADPPSMEDAIPDWTGDSERMARALTSACENELGDDACLWSSRGKRWTECDDAVLISAGSDALYFFKPAGFVYYLPAYLRSLVQSDALRGLSGTLECIFDPSLNSDIPDVVNRLTKTQIDLVADVIGLLIDRRDVCWADARNAIGFLLMESQSRA